MTSVSGAGIADRWRGAVAAGRRLWGGLDRGWRASVLGLLVIAATVAL